MVERTLSYCTILASFHIISYLVALCSISIQYEDVKVTILLLKKNNKLIKYKAVKSYISKNFLLDKLNLYNKCPSLMILKMNFSLHC